MNDSQIETLEQVRQFLDGVAVMKITIPSKTESYRWIQGTLVRFRYAVGGPGEHSRCARGGAHTGLVTQRDKQTMCR